MFPFTRPPSLLRYLLVWRVNGSLVWLPDCPAVEISRVLGTLIAERLPTRRAAPWRKALAPWDEYEARKGRKPLPDAPWPLDATIFAYPGKRSYGQGELILWELELLGESADHGHFLELVLPALEEAARTRDRRWHQTNSLWGQFDVHGAYAARGNGWEPFVQAGKLDLQYAPTARQWLDGLPFNAPSDRLFERLTWLTPFDLTSPGRRRHRGKKIPAREVPTLGALLEALEARLTALLPGKHNTPDDLWAALGDQDRAAFQEAVEQAAAIPVRSHKLGRAPKNWPGRWIGHQFFPFVPPALVPYLQVASILHVGQHTHLGCGTFALA